jgi:hypothetical protein
MKRFLVFYYTDYEAKGGIENVATSSDIYKDCLDFLNLPKTKEDEMFRHEVIFDCDKRKIIYEKHPI